jgi:hypothetical protein
MNDKSRYPCLFLLTDYTKSCSQYRFAVKFQAITKGIATDSGFDTCKQ